MSLASNPKLDSGTITTTTADRRKNQQRRATNKGFNDPDPLIDTASQAQRRTELATLASGERQRSRGRRSSTLSGGPTIPEEEGVDQNSVGEPTGPKAAAGGGKRWLDGDNALLIRGWEQRIDLSKEPLEFATFLDFRKQFLEKQTSLQNANRDYEKTVDHLASLRDNAGYLIDAHEEGERRGLGEIEALLSVAKDFTKEQGSIQALSARLKMEEKKVEIYDERLRGITNKMADVQIKEQLWRDKQSRRLRYLWGVGSLLLVVWLLMSIVPMQEVAPKMEAVLDPLAPELLITEEDLEDISSPQVIFGLSQGSQSVDARLR